MEKLNIRIDIGNNKKHIADIIEILEPYKITDRDNKSLGECLSKIILSNKYVTFEKVLD